MIYGYGCIHQTLPNCWIIKAVPETVFSFGYLFYGIGLIGFRQDFGNYYFSSFLLKWGGLQAAPFLSSLSSLACLVDYRYLRGCGVCKLYA